MLHRGLVRMGVDSDIEKVVSFKIKSVGIVWFESNVHEDNVIPHPPGMI